MATIKMCTDIPQSKKLAKILPLESADMYWDLLSKDKYAKVNNIGTCLGRTCVYAWSLASLLSILPKNLNIGRPSLDSNYKGYYWIQYYDEYMNPINYKTECFNNPIDACVAMIEKLNELNLL